MSREVTPPDASPIADPDKRRPRWRRWLLYGVALCVLVWLAIPFAISWIGRGIAESRASSILGSGVEVDALDFGWFSGVDVSGVLVQEPEKFASSPAAFQVTRVQAKIGLWGALRGRYDVFARVEAPRLHVVRGREGEINWLTLLQGATGTETTPPEGPPADEGGREPSPTPREGTPGPLIELPPLRLDVLLTDGRVEIEDQQSGTTHALENLRVEISSESFSPPLRFVLNADVAGGAKPGSLRIEAQFDPARDAVSTLVFTTAGLDLAPYQPLLRSFGIDLDRVEGVLDGNLTAELRPAASQANAQEVVLGGELRGQGLHVSGPLLEAREFDVPQLVLQPALRLDPSTGIVDTTKLRIDAGFVTLLGLPEGEVAALFTEGGAPPALGLHATVKLPALGAQKGLLPPDMVLEKGLLDVKLAVRGDLNPTSTTFLARPLELRIQGQGEKVRLSGTAVPEGVVPANFEFSFPTTFDPNSAALSIRGGLLSFVGSRVELDATVEGEAVSADVKGELSKPYMEVLVAAFGPSKLSPKGPLSLDSHLEATLPLDTEDLQKLLHGARTKTEVEIPALSFLDNKLTGMKLGLALDNGAISVRMPVPAMLNGGAFSIGVTLQADDATGWPVAADFSWKGGDAGGSFAPLLRYAVPLLAGLESSELEGLTKLDLKTGIDLGLNLRGPLKKGEETSWLQYLSAFAGSGDLGLRDGAFTPSGQLAELVKLGGKDGKLSFSTLSTHFDLDSGKVRSPAILVSGGDKTYSLAGNTELGGGMDYRLDLSGLLAGLGSGDKVRELLGDQKLEAVLGGTLTSPKLDLGASAQQLLQGLSGNLLQDLQSDPAGAVDRIRNLFDRSKKKDGE